MKLKTALSTLCLVLCCCAGISSLVAQNALDFDGTDDHVLVANASGFVSGASGISLSMWVYPVNTASAWPDFDGFGGFRNDSNCDFYLCQLSSTGVEARFRNSSGTAFDITTSTLVLNTWQHFVLTYNGSALSLYRNGILLTSNPASGSISNTAVTMYLGKLVYSANNFNYQGKIDEVSLWSKALSASEVSGLYSGVINTTDANLKLYYKFDQGVASGSNTGITTLNDTKGNANGTLMNFALTGNTSNWVGGVLLAVPADAGVPSVVAPTDSICAGLQPVKVVLKNYGPNPLATAKINWKINNSLQTQYTWSGNLPVNGTDTVTLGNYSFHKDTLYTLQAWSSLPNNLADTATANDTVTKAGIYVKAAPSLSLTGTVVPICQGDTANITGTLAGIAPWTVVVGSGTTQQTLSNLTASAFSYKVTPASTTTYTVQSVSDAGGCVNTTTVAVTVTVNPAPPATISPSGTQAFCQGDSLVLTATIGLNFTYQWKKDGVNVQGANNFIYTAKQGGAYTVQVTSNIGCATLSQPVTLIMHPAPVVALGNDTTVSTTTTLVLNAGPGLTSYLWSNGSMTQIITVDSTGTGLGTKSIWVMVTDNHGCKGTDTIKITFAQNPGIDDRLHQAAITISPNPSNGRLTVDLCGTDLNLTAIRVCALDGREAYSLEALAGHACTIDLDLAWLPKGTYLVWFESSQGERCQKILLTD
ncbi:MAG TPA: hypothetical protein P5228_02145 [Bacteroidales bacterium]|nr:hypothetical protein [Bacteroidales bacterium]HRZ50043.1 hypothetical protein [Bacteroidales bacterium]